MNKEQYAMCSKECGLYFFIGSWYVTRVLVKVTLISWLVVYFGFILEEAQPVIYLIYLVFILHKSRLLQGVFFTQSSYI